MKTSKLFRVVALGTITAALAVSGIRPVWASEASGTVVQVGSANLRLVAPTNQIDCSGLKDPVRSAAEQFCPPVNRLLGVFATPAFQKAVLGGSESSADAYAMIQIPRRAVSYDMPATEFREVKSMMKREQQTLLASMSSEVNQMVKNLTRQIENRDGPALDLKVGQPVSLGVADEGTSHQTTLMLARVQGRIGATPFDEEMVCSMTLLHLRGKLVFAYAYDTYHGKASVEAMKKQTGDWVARLISANE